MAANAEIPREPQGRRSKDNPRFLVTSLPASNHPAKKLYENYHSARGDPENTVKRHKTALFARRCSSNLFSANALRFLFSTFACVLIERLRQAMKSTEFERASLGTLRLRLLHIGGLVRASVRRILIALSSVFPDPLLFRHAWHGVAPHHPTSTAPGSPTSSRSKRGGKFPQQPPDCPKRKTPVRLAQYALSNPVHPRQRAPCL